MWASVNAFAKEGCFWIELLGKTGKKRNFNTVYTTFNRYTNDGLVV